MIPSRFLKKFRELILPLCLGGTTALILLTAVPMRSGQNPPPPTNVEIPATPPAVNDQAALISPQQKEEPKKTHREKSKADAAELSALADKLSAELNKMNINVLSLDVIQKTKEIEELAKKIKGEAHEH